MLKKILVVEDDNEMLNLLKLTLEMEDYVVEGINNGKETFEKVYAFQPDLIVLDILLNGEDGRKICRSLKKHEDFKYIPVVMMSAYVLAEASAKESGADAFYSKPYDMGEFCMKIDQLVGKDVEPEPRPFVSSAFRTITG